jgi:hypothetical protein
LQHLPTPGSFQGQPDMGKFLAGGSVGFEIPGVGTYFPPNLTPDAATGLGDWSEDEIVQALRAGERSGIR